jgi:hypothetical protein
MLQNSIYDRQMRFSFANKDRLVLLEEQCCTEESGQLEELD